MLSSQLGQPLRVAQRNRVGECLLDLGRSSQHVC
jgi:hypothetical protein